MASIQKRPDGKWRARYRDLQGKEHSRHFARKADAQAWLDQVTTALVTGTYTAPRDARMTVDQWCDVWIEGYKARRPSTVRQALVHLERIRAEFGRMQLAAVRPSHVKTWTAKLRAQGLAASYVYALHGRLAQLFNDAVHDGIVPRSPCSRRTSPGMGKQKPYVITTEQMWALHDEVEDWAQPAVLLGALVGLRPAEVCGLRVEDVDFMRRMVYPRVQFPAEPLKTETSTTPVPIDDLLALQLSASVQARPGDWLVLRWGRQVSPWTLEREIRTAKERLTDLPAKFSFHDLRHYYASMLIAAGLDVKVVQARLRHASAKTTLDVYGHLWPDADESARAAVTQVFAARADSLRTRGPSAARNRRSEPRSS